MKKDKKEIIKEENESISLANFVQNLKSLPKEEHKDFIALANLKLYQDFAKKLESGEI